jgi:hypothetical protein
MSEDSYPSSMVFGELFSSFPDECSDDEYRLDSDFVSDSSWQSRDDKYTEPEETKEYACITGCVTSSSPGTSICTVCISMKLELKIGSPLSLMTRVHCFHCIPKSKNSERTRHLTATRDICKADCATVDPRVVSYNPHHPRSVPIDCPQPSR